MVYNYYEYRVMLATPKGFHLFPAQIYVRDSNQSAVTVSHFLSQNTVTLIKNQAHTNRTTRFSKEITVTIH